MSLLKNAMENCVILDKTTQRDGYGGVVTVWVDGAEISAAIVPDGGVEQLLAQQRNWRGSYTILTSKAVELMSGDVIKRLSDNKIFRIKSDGTDDKTPKGAGLDIRKVKAEEYEI